MNVDVHQAACRGVGLPGILIQAARAGERSRATAVHPIGLHGNMKPMMRKAIATTAITGPTNGKTCRMEQQRRWRISKRFAPG
jgi:hypothetical protein